jgi:hypothetical protein
MNRIRVVLLIFIFLPSPAVLRAQSTNASVAGRVTDPSKAVISDAKVAATNTDTNVRYEDATNNSGDYYLTNLPPGSYRIEIEKTGFRKLIKPDVILHVQDTLAIDFEMTLGSGTESITVQAGAPVVNTESATVSTVIDRTFVENLPLNGRSFQTLIMLTPGVVVTQTAFDDQGQFSVNGQRADANYFTVDGVSANFGVTGYPALVQSGGGALPALSAQGGTNSLVSIEAMQEFRVQTSSFAPEFGRTPGGQISILTRSGTNRFHGALFEYFRNDALDANDWFSNYNHLPKPEERQNDFGGVLGGPILRDRTFFFFSYEGLRLRQPGTQETVVPDLASRQSAPASMQPYLDAYPDPNGPAAGAGLAQFNGSYSNPSSLDAYSARVDHGINSKLSLFGRYSYSPSRSNVRDAFGVLSGTELVSASVQTFTVGLDQTVTTGINNEARANYSNERVGSEFQMDNFGGAVPLTNGEMYPSEFSTANGLFEFNLQGAGTLADGLYGTDEQRQINVIDNLSWSKGRHQLKFGGDYRWQSPFTRPFAYFLVAGFAGVTANSGGVLSGAASYAETGSNQTVAFLTQNYSLYGQDTWNAKPRLSLTYGLRWDVNTALKGKNLASQPFTLLNLDDPANLALAPTGTALYQTRYGSVAPRVGVAYQLKQLGNWLTVLRGGFGIFYDLGYGSVGGTSSYFPFFANNIIAPSTCASGVVGTCFPLTPQQAAPPPLTTSPPVNTINVVDPQLKVPRTYQWNVTLEQSLGTSQTLSLAYVGAVGRDLLRVTNIVNPNPNFGFVGVTDNSATSDYDALQIRFQRRLSRGLQVLGSYTLSHSIDDASTDAFANYLNAPSFVYDPRMDRGNSDFDIRHAFTTGLTYSVPTPRWNKFSVATLGGWSVDTFVLARSAPPVNIVGPLAVAAGTAFYPRPDVVPGVAQVLYGSQYPGGKAFNNLIKPAACPGGADQVGAWCPAPAGQQGIFGRNVLRGFGATQADVAFQRQFPVSEQLNLQFRAEFFNVLNHPNFGPPDNNLADALFGQSTQTLASSLGSGGADGGFNPLYQVGGPRSIQLALKLLF